MMNNTELVLGYDLSYWNNYNAKFKITTDISTSTNSHILICGMSGSGKSYYQTLIFKKLVELEKDGEFYFADYKQDDSFKHLQGLSRYYSYKNTLDGLDIVYNRLNDRLSGVDETRNQITLIWDEYIANILALINEDKKNANIVMNKVSEILLMGRSKNIRLIVSCQRSDAIAFPVGSRLNYGIIVILGAYIKSVYEMLVPDFINEVKVHTFSKGEGSILLQGSKLRFVKVPTVKDIEKANEICINALSSDTATQQ